MKHAPYWTLLALALANEWALIIYSLSKTVGFFAGMDTPPTPAEELAGFRDPILHYAPRLIFGAFAFALTMIALYFVALARALIGKGADA